MSSVKLECGKLDCGCVQKHPRKIIVLTGGPSAGKTAIFELAKTWFCHHVAFIPEGATIVYGNGILRGRSVGEIKQAQQQIFNLHLEHEKMLDDTNLCCALSDRAGLDCLAYWPDSEDNFWHSIGSSQDIEFAKVSMVIHLQTPQIDLGYSQDSNAVRTEDVQAALELDQKLLNIWKGHPRHYIISAQANFKKKALAVLALLVQEISECCVSSARLSSAQNNSISI